jgi:hypothetical protein
VKFGKEFSEKSGILGGDGEDPQTSEFFGGTHFIPCNFTLPPIARFFPSPEESPASFVNGLHNTGREKPGSHGMGKHSCEHRIDQKKTAADGTAAAAPARKLHVAFCHEWGIVRDAKFVSGEGKAEIGLWERRNRAAEGRSHDGSGVRVSLNGDKGTFMEVNRETCSLREVIENLLQVCHVLRDGPNNDEGVVGILKDRTRKVIHKRVEEEASLRHVKQQLLEDIDVYTRVCSCRQCWASKCKGL